ncbi:hypothetical protein P5V15_009768 [Pogonomyrmex californicus]
MSVFKLDDNDNPRELSRSPAEDNGQTSISAVTCRNSSSTSEYKENPDHEVLDIMTDLVAKVQAEVEKCENRRNEKVEATNDVDEYVAPLMSVNYNRIFDLSHENSSYFNSNVTSDCDMVSMYNNFDYNDKTIQGEDSDDSEKTIQDEFLIDEQYANSLNSLTELRESLVSVDATYDKICQMRRDREKFVDSGISSTSGLMIEDNSEIMRQAIVNYVDSYKTDDTIDYKIIEENIKSEEMKLAQNITYIKNSFQEELDIKNVEFNNCFINSNENYFKDHVNLSKYTEKGNTRQILSAEDDTIEKTEIKEMDCGKVIKNLLCNSDDEHHASTEEQMIENLSVKMEDDHDDVMRKIVETCSHTPTNFQQHSPIHENFNMDPEQSNSEYIIKKFQGDELLSSHRRVVSESAIAKEDILKTIEEAKKILSENPYWDTSETKDNHIEICDKDNSSEKSMEEINNDKNCEKVNETINKKGTDLTENEDTINSANTIIAEKIAVSESDIVESNLQKLAEITCSDRPRSSVEIRETLEKIAEEKRKIEDRKKESLETLSKKFEEIDKLIADHNYTSHVSENDFRKLETPEDFAADSDSLDEFQVQIDTKNLEVPLTKSEITESLMIEELEKELVDEMEEHKKLMDEYQEIITMDLDKIQLTLESESTPPHSDVNIDEEIKDKCKDDGKTNDEFLNEESKMTIDINSESDDSFLEDFKEPEKTYIKGKVYDFDEKKHGVRMTEELIRKHCKEHKLYQTPYLNDVLYLHYKGFSFIENLEKYTGLKCLWLESNGIREIANLENQSKLKCLYLHHNLISRIENLDCLTKLDTLNLSHNMIRRIENLGDLSRKADSLKFLNNLNLSHNYLRETADVEHLRLLHALSILDISHNKIDTCDIVDILGDMKSLRVLTLTGNPVLKQIKMYRKTMILKCKNLQYLDDRPVFPRDRACAEAWMRGGIDEEVAERNRWIQAEQKKINDSVMGELKDSLIRGDSSFSIFVYLSTGASTLESPDKQKEAAQTGRDVRKGGG